MTDDVEAIEIQKFNRAYCGLLAVPVRQHDAQFWNSVCELLDWGVDLGTIVSGIERWCLAAKLDYWSARLIRAHIDRPAAIPQRYRWG